MQTLYLVLGLFLLLKLVAGMLRVLRGPTVADRMLAAQLFRTTAVAILLFLAQTSANAALRDVAMLSALLAAVAFVRLAWSNEDVKHDAECLCRIGIAYPWGRVFPGRHPGLVAFSRCLYPASLPDQGR